MAGIIIMATWGATVKSRMIKYVLSSQDIYQWPTMEKGVEAEVGTEKGKTTKGAVVCKRFISQDVGKSRYKK